MEINREINNDIETGLNPSSNLNLINECFDEISEETIQIWERLLLANNRKIAVVKDDSELLNEELNLINQRVIKNDCDRTRVKDKPLLVSFREYLELFLTYYCKKNDVKYKQGMNEIFGPFILLKSKVKISLSKIYNICSSFIEKFLTNYYYEDEFYSLQSSLAMLNLLLKYHEPVMYNIFFFGIITPEMYATSWILTIFANKTKLGVIYHLWDILIQENDELFIHFFIIAFLKFNQDAIINTDHSQIPSVLSQLYLKNNSEVDSIANKARELRSTTPYSFRLLVGKLEVFHPRSKRLKELFNKYEPENMIALPICVSEVFYIAYNNIVNCPDSRCKSFKVLHSESIYAENSNSENENNSLEKEKLTGIRNKIDKIDKILCYNCINKTEKESLISYILLDLRISNIKDNKNKSQLNDDFYDNKPGFLPMTVILDQSELDDENFSENLSDRFLYEKDKYHFILITSETDYFSEYEEKYYKEIISEKDKRKMMYGLQTKISKEINTKLVSQSIKRDKSKKIPIRIKEFDILRKLIACFLKKNFAYISYVQGGFKDIHEESIKYNIPLLNHDDSCSLCKKTRKKNQNKGFFSNLFRTKIKNESHTPVHKVVGGGASQSEKPEKLELDKNLKKSQSSKCLEPSSFTKSNLSIIPIGDKIIENLNKIEGDSSNLYSIDEISNLISDPNYIVYTCLLVEYKNLYNKFEKGPPQIMLFLDNRQIKIYKLERHLVRNNENESLSFVLIESIKICEIITIITRKQTKNIVTIQFTSDLFGKTSIIIDLITDIDSKSFISKTKQIIETFIKEQIK